MYVDATGWRMDMGQHDEHCHIGGGNGQVNMIPAKSYNGVLFGSSISGMVSYVVTYLYLFFITVLYQVQESMHKCSTVGRVITLQVL